MTHDEWVKLSEYERDIKVGELCGWTNIHRCTRHEYDMGGDDLEGMLDSLVGFPKGGKDLMPLPHFIFDLNAMRKVIEALPHKLRSEWCIQLAVFTDPDKQTPNEKRDCHWYRIAQATAAQRAEAFVCTMEKP